MDEDIGNIGYTGGTKPIFDSSTGNIGYTGGTGPRRDDAIDFFDVSNICCSVYNKRYSLIVVQNDDISLTVAETGKILSVNKLIEDVEELQKKLDLALSSPFPGADFVKTFKEEYPDEPFLSVYRDFLSQTDTNSLLY